MSQPAHPARLRGMTHQTTEIVADVVVVGAGYAGVIAANGL